MTAAGRQDQNIPLFGYRTRAKITLSLMAAVLFAAWHLAVVRTTSVAVEDLNSTVKALATLKPLAGVGGGGATLAWFGAMCGAALALFVGILELRAKWRGRGRRGKGMAIRSEVAQRFGVEAARAKAPHLRPGLAKPEKADIDDLGHLVGHEPHGGAPIVIPFDDHVCVVAPTGAGKSRDVLIPAAQTAPGALVVTTNEATILDALVPARRHLGRIWVFDPLERTSWGEPMVWDAVAGCERADRANARGAAFCSGIAAGETRSGNEAFFVTTATTAMETMLHAGALRGLTMGAVLDFALNMAHSVDVPAQIIRTSNHPEAEPRWAAALEGVATGADDTVASTRTTLQGAVKPMLRRSVLRWVDPLEADAFAARQGVGDSGRINVPRFDPEDFVRSTDTLVLVSDDNSSTDVGPLCAMLFQEVIDAVKEVAVASPGQRLDPPLRIAGDEIANVAPIPKLPEIATEIRKLGAQLVLAFQDDGQATSRWGKDRGMKLLTQMGAEIVLPGVKSAATLERFSKLSGEVEVLERSSNVDGETGRHNSSGLSVHTRPVLRPDEIRGMPDGQGLLIYRNVAPFFVKMQPWWERPGGGRLRREVQVEAQQRADRAAATRERRSRANGMYGHSESEREAS